MDAGVEARWLADEMAEMRVVDAHEHLPRESTRLAEPADALTFYRQYTRLVMFSAGLDEDTFMRMHDPDLPWGQRLDIFEPWRELIRHSGPARAARIALRRFYGEDEVTRRNYEAITAGMAELYRPGLYDRVLRQVCNIGAVLQNSDDPAYGDPLLRPVAMTGIGGEWHSFPDLAGQIVRGEHGFDSLDHYLEELHARLRRLKECGVVAFKHTAHLYCDPDRQRAEQVLAALRGGDEHWTRTSVPNPLWNWFTDQLLAVAGELDLPVCVHTGVWGDFRELAVTEMIPHIARHPEVRFDLFHMGLPAVREMGRIGANFGNVWLNMCWAHTVSPTMAASALDEWLDQVGVNKIIAFGGDVRWPVEKVYGHLTLAREVVATVLGRRIAAGLMDRHEALGLARKVFRENPAQLYQLDAAPRQSTP